MVFRETDIHYSLWLYPKKQDSLFFIFVFSILLHILFFYLMSLIKIGPINNSTTNSHDLAHIFFKKNSNKNHFQQNEKTIISEIPEINLKKTLTDQNPNSKSKHYLPKKTITTNKTPDKKEEQISSKHSEPKNLTDFLPHSSTSYINQLRNEANKQKIAGDIGDIPIIGDELAPRKTPKIIPRHAFKDLSLYQFDKEFKERFSGIWSSKERWVPPSSPLRPGDIVYYKLYIKGDGSLQKFENLSRILKPMKDFTAVDQMIAEVVAQVFPMVVPPRFAQDLITEIVAIQVVDSNLPVQYSFQ